jgi:hypothetical protein
MSDPKTNARTIFSEAVENVPRQQWPAFLDEQCGDDQNLRGQVERLLNAHEDIGSFMGQPAAEPSPTIERPVTERPGIQIGPYKLLQIVGEGGMGVVYMAEQTKPVWLKCMSHAATFRTLARV